MKKIFLRIFISFIILALSQPQFEYIYNPEKIIDFINDKKLEKTDYNDIIDYLSDTFNDAYAFNDISINPPQPSFNQRYHNSLDIQLRLSQIKEKVNYDEINEVYDFYREISIALSELKDSHIQLIWKFLNLNEYFLLAPVEFYIKDTNEGPKIFASCLSEEFIDCNDFELPEQLEICSRNEENDSPVSLINDKDPFDFINEFGGNFLSTKNDHSTFSFKLFNHNKVSFGDFPLSLEELKNLKIVFESGDTINTKYYIGTDSETNIEEEEGNLRNLNTLKNISLKEKNKSQTKKKNKYERIINRNKRRLNDIIWNYDESEIKCYEDTINEINLYYISSFNPEDKNRYIKAIKDCYKLFDQNSYPIIVINDLNDGGYVYLSQIFLGIISPLISIDLYKGRIRITDTFKETDDIIKYIDENLASTENCLHTSYENLINKKIEVEYGDIKSSLTDIFFINNITTHNEIESARRDMNNKRKPTEILVYTDGYSFSATSLFLKYLHKNGGGIIAGYLGNPKYKNEKKFDISQSPSPIFSHKLLKIFSPENYNNLISLNKENEDDEETWEIQFPGIQTFYNSEDNKIPLEYEVIEPDIHSDIFINFDMSTYQLFINKSKMIFEKYKTDCNPNNKNLVKVTEECDNKFGNNYTHGGYECGSNGKWTNKCVASYCDMGYFFNQKTKKCIKDICSSIPVVIIEEEPKTNNDTKKDIDNCQKNIYLNLLIMLFIFF